MKLINNPHFKASVTLLTMLIVIWLALTNPKIAGVILITLFTIVIVLAVYVVLYSLFDEDI